MRKTARRAICGFVVLFALSLILVGTALAEYVHAYYRYEVEDGSITITGYVGSDEVATVPAMIAGNPVNVIGRGAFTKSLSVKTVRVHTSVIEVQAGALAPGQTLEYIDNDGNPLDMGAAGGTTDDAQGEAGTRSEDGVQAEDNTVAAMSAQPKTPLGIRLKDGSLVTVDYDGNLLLVDANYNERVLDDTQAYTREATEDGSVVIRDAAGRVVEVDPEAATVSYVNKDGEQIKHDSLQSLTEITDKDGNTFSIEDTKFEDVEIADTKPANSEQAAQIEQNFVAPIIVALVVGAGIGVYFLCRRKNRTTAKE